MSSDGGGWPEVGRASGTGGRRGLAPTLLTVTWLLPLVVAPGLSVAHRVLVLVPVVLLAASGVVPAVRSRKRRGRGWLARAGTGGSEGSPGPEDDPASLLLTTVAGRVPAPSGPLRITDLNRVDPFAQGSIALVGAAPAVRAAARWLVCRTAADRVTAVAVEAPGTRTAWRWLRGLPGGGPGAGGTAAHSRAVGAGAPGRGSGGEGSGVFATGSGRRGLGTGGPTAGEERARTLLVVDLLDPVEQPSDRLPGDHPGGAGSRAEVVLAPSLDRVPARCHVVVEVPDEDTHLVSEAWARRVAVALGTTRHPVGTVSALPTEVPIGELLDDPESAWPNPDGALTAAWAVGSDGRAVEVDLVRDGPHALVAGTTGSGKSELLLAWVLALTSRYPPSALTIVAIDYKGGATFATVAGLPHVAGVYTDLDAAGTTRALTGLRAELARRERLLAATGARDLAEYARRGGLRGAPSASRDGDSGRIPGPDLPRLLVVVDEFRVLSDAHPDLMAGLVRLAAQGRSLGMHLVLATQRPGGAVGPDLRANIQLSVCLRVVGSSDSFDVLGTAEGARLAAVPGRALVAADTTEEVQVAWCGSDDAVRDVGTRILALARARGERLAAPLWPPPLPSDARVGRHGGDEPHVTEAGEGARPAPGLPMLLTERADDLRREPWDWPADASGIVVVGNPRSGRSTALRTLAVGALARGRTVHMVGRVDLPADHPGLGTVVDPTDPRRLGRLLDLLADRPGPDLLCLDDVDAVLAAVSERLGPDVLERLVRARIDGLALAVAGPVSALSARWAATLGHRVVLGPLEASTAAVAGVPRRMLVPDPPPGRGVLLGAGAPRTAQVLRYSPDEALPAAPRFAAGQAGGPLRLRPLPRQVDEADLPASRPDVVPIGVGGDAAEPLWVAVGDGARVVVAGPPESGRTAALHWLSARLRALGRPVVSVRPGHGAAGLVAGAGAGDAIVVDDAEALDGAPEDAVAARWAAPGGVVIASVRTDTLASSYRPLAALLRQARTVVLLAPLRGGTGHLAAGDVLPHADPTATRLPGRGVLVEPRRAAAVQLPTAGTLAP